MASTAQQVQDTRGRSINYMYWIEEHDVYISFIKNFIKFYFTFYQINIISIFKTAFYSKILQQTWLYTNPI